MGDGLELGLKLPVPCDGAGELSSPNLETLAALTRSIAAKRLCKIDYVSLSSGRSTRVIAPIALVDTGRRWHLRAFDRIPGPGQGCHDLH
jgi:predicted DNA-binding transcriptional regulator YafY